MAAISPAGHLNRRTALRAGAALLGGAALCAHPWHSARAQSPGSAPVPIPGQQPGLGLPPNAHVYLPQPGREPNTIYNFDGFIALTEFQGMGADQAGNPLIVLGDMRLMAGDYIGADQARHSGTFGFI